MKRSYLLGCVLGGLYLASSCQVGAQPLQNATVDQLVEQLAPSTPMRTRGMRNLAPQRAPGATAGTDAVAVNAPDATTGTSTNMAAGTSTSLASSSAAADTPTAPEAPRSVDLVINFNFDSASLQPASKPLLDVLAIALSSDKLKTIRFKVEGHTDANGQQAYNQQLSSRRAESVVSYLTEKGVPKDRMLPEGKGFSELLYPEKPTAMENRRVRITALQ
jgi:outer membrane protein OmpA-like peptidoglycan-associated protein